MAANPEQHPVYRGQVTAIDEDAEQFTMSLDSGGSITLPFNPDDSPLLYRSLYGSKLFDFEAHLERGFNGSFKPRIVLTDKPIPKDAYARYDKFLEHVWSLPPETWEGVPTDLAQNLDYYLYGEGKSSL